MYADQSLCHAPCVPVPTPFVSFVFLIIFLICSLIDTDIQLDLDLVAPAAL